MLEPYGGVKVERRRKWTISSDDQDVQGVIQILVMRELSLMQVCLEEQDGVISHGYLQDTNMIKKEWRNEVQGQDEPSQRDHMLEACHPYGDHGYVKICLKESLSRRSMGEQLARLHQARASMHNQERCSNLRRTRTRSSSSSSSGMRKAKVWSW